MLHVFQLLTILFGFVCIVVPVYYGIYFYRHGKKIIGSRLAFMLWAEANSAAGVVYFAINSYFNIYNVLSPELVIVVRVYLLAIPLITTILLSRYHQREMDIIKKQRATDDH